MPVQTSKKILTMTGAGLLMANTGTAAPAADRLVDLHGGLHLGGSTGIGTGTGRGRDHFDVVKGPAAGFRMGLKLLALDLSLAYTHVVGGRGTVGPPGGGAIASDEGESFTVGTLTQVLLGVESSHPLRGGMVLRPRLAGGVAFGTQGPIDLPLSGRQVTHKGVLGQMELSLERYVTDVLAIGVVLEGGYHWFLRGGEIANDPNSWSGGVHMNGFVTATAHLGL